MRDNRTVNLSAIVVGALIAVLFHLGFTLLSGTVGLAAFTLEQGGLSNTNVAAGAGLVLLVLNVLAFFIGGYVAARFAQVRRNWDAALHGLASFALATILTAVLAGDSPGEATLGRAHGAGEQVNDVVEPLLSSPEEALGELHKAAARASLGALALLIAGGLGSVWGGRRGGRAALRVLRSEQQKRPIPVKSTGFEQAA